MFIVLSSCLEHCESSPGSFDECSSKRQVAADLWTKPTDLNLGLLRPSIHCDWLTMTKKTS